MRLDAAEGARAALSVLTFVLQIPASVTRALGFRHKVRRAWACEGSVGGMLLADRIAQCRVPFMVQRLDSGVVTRLSGAAEYAHLMRTCPLRFVLTDQLIRLCTALAYSRGARTLECADLLHIPAERVWVEWAQTPWERELSLHRFTVADAPPPAGARRGALINASRDGRRGHLRTFWTNGDAQVMAASMEAYFDLDAPEGEISGDWAKAVRGGFQVAITGADRSNVLSRCFRFAYERSWGDYYARAGLGATEAEAVRRHVAGTIAHEIPMLMVFFLLLSTRTSLPRRTQTLDRLNRARRRRGQPPLLEHVEVTCPLLAQAEAGEAMGVQGARRRPRLHHVRGHLYRRGSELFWRVPHLRGNARYGAVSTRTVRWTFDPSA